MHIRRYLLLLALGLWSCAAPKPTPAPPITPTYADGGLISGEPCGPPCFWQIVPGQTTQAEALAIALDELKLNDCQLFSDADRHGFNCDFLVAVTFAAGSDVVASVALQLDVPVTVGEAIAVLGEPNAVAVNAEVGPQATRTRLMLYFDETHTRLTLPFEPGYGQLVSESVLVAHVSYSDPASYAPAREVAAPWTGYGTYQP
jgi:hypothetical protein